MELNTGLLLIVFREDPLHSLLRFSGFFCLPFCTVFREAVSSSNGLPRSGFFHLFFLLLPSAKRFSLLSGNRASPVALIAGVSSRRGAASLVPGDASVRVRPADLRRNGLFGRTQTDTQRSGR